MSQENVEIVRGAFAAFQQGDLSRMLDLMADDFVTHRVHPYDAIYYGKEGFLKATADWTEGFQDWTATAEEFIDAGDFVVARVRQTGRVEGSDVAVESDFWFAFTLRGGKIARVSFHPRRAEALEAAGLRE